MLAFLVDNQNSHLGISSVKRQCFKTSEKFGEAGNSDRVCGRKRERERRVESDKQRTELVELLGAPTSNFEVCSNGGIKP